MGEGRMVPRARLGTLHVPGVQPPSHTGWLPCAGCGGTSWQSTEAPRPCPAGPFGLCSVEAGVARCRVKCLLIPLPAVRQRESLLPPGPRVPICRMGLSDRMVLRPPLGCLLLEVAVGLACCPGLRGCCRAGTGPQAVTTALPAWLAGAGAGATPDLDDLFSLRR